MQYISEQFEPAPLVTSVPLAWSGVRIEQYRLGKIELPAHHHEHHLLLLYQTTQPMHVRHQREGRVEERTFRTGDLGLYPSGNYGRVSCQAPCENIYLTIEQPYLARLTEQAPRRLTLRERFGFNDPFLAQLIRQLLMVADSQPKLGPLYVESLVTALCCQLLEHHATDEPRLAPHRSLPSQVLARIDTYLEAHADTPITLGILAELANLSVFHFARLFKQTTGGSPYQYVLARKMRQAQQLLRANDMAVADVSDALGFASPANFAVAFKRATGHSPLDFRRS